ncbi:MULTISPECIES: hypothetical protein [unclassified Streptomyces]|uniref:hypothetical protein n=1 Tax=unclassified Streptomyces TaxID=2593676 RepID=UPI002366A418|nr:MULTISPECIES: hypothetical protein [unclassified Streptomyces]MDF3141784.1 hypothetical protein [Streptomyces sp. T21Q-yed]WDF36441.1 hypothetical protein PBV52_06465 [Streptomyces sp. T12]
MVMGPQLTPGTPRAAAIRRVLVVGLTRGEGFIREYEKAQALEVIGELDGTRCPSCSQGKSEPNGTSEVPEGENGDDVCVAADAARILGVSDSYIRRIAEGKLGGRKVKGKWQLSGLLVMEEKKRKREED